MPWPAIYELLANIRRLARHLISQERLPFTATYFGSIALTLYFALGVSTHVLSYLHPRYRHKLAVGGGWICRCNVLMIIPVAQHNIDTVDVNRPDCRAGLVSGVLLSDGLARATICRELRWESNSGVDERVSIDQLCKNENKRRHDLRYPIHTFDCTSFVPSISSTDHCHAGCMRGARLRPLLIGHYQRSANVVDHD